jgi:para-aminobenzoate synthetase/4-amino-4-deoxychorismate lyase
MTGSVNRRHSLPAQVYALVEQTPETVLLENSLTGAPEQRSWLFTSPLRVITAGEAAQLPNLFALIEGAVAAGCFVAGFFTYECGAAFEPTAAMRSPQAGEPLAWFGVYERGWLFDHTTGAFVDGDPPGLARYPADKMDEEPAAEPPLDCSFGIPEEQYSERIAAIHEWIRAGDIYQLNFTAPLRMEVRGSAAALYRRLRSRQPVEYGAFLHWQPNRRILSFSPELLFRQAIDYYAAHERDRAARPHDPRRPGDCRATAPGPQEPQRKRDDRGPAAQRPGPPLPLRQRAR